MDDSKPIALRSAEQHFPKYRGGRVDRTSRAAGAITGEPKRIRKQLAVAHRACHAGKPEGGRTLDPDNKNVYLGITEYCAILKYDDDLGYDGDVEPDSETETQRWKRMLIKDLSQMMFVSGETAEPSPETTGMIEEIVRQQVVEMVSLVLTGFVTFE